MCSFGVHTAAPDLQPTSDPILCGGREPLQNVMASVLPAEATGTERASGETPQQEGKGKTAAATDEGGGDEGKTRPERSRKLVVLS